VQNEFNRLDERTGCTVSGRLLPINDIDKIRNQIRDFCLPLRHIAVKDLLSVFPEGRTE